MFEKILEVFKGFRSDARKAMKDEASKPITVSIMGVTGVGKTSLINAIFGTDLKVGHVRPATQEIHTIKVSIKEGKGELIFHDLPGANEAENTADKYLELYAKQAIKSDIVLWAMSHERSEVAPNQEYLSKLINSLDEKQRIKFYNKITFVLTKADTINLKGGTWYYNETNQHIKPNDVLVDVINEKEIYFKEMFIDYFSKYVNTSARKNEECKMRVPQEDFLKVKSGKIHCSKVLTISDLGVLYQKYPQCKDTFEKIYIDQSVVLISSEYQFNLVRLLYIMLDKFELPSLFRIKNFINVDDLETMNKKEAEQKQKINFNH
jgi:uncharacterized protein